MRHDYRVSRRAAIVGALAGLTSVGLSGCQNTQWYPSEITPDEYILRSVIADKQRAIASYRATLSADQGPTETLRTLLSNHERHLRALRQRLPADAASPETSASAATPSAAADPTPEGPLSVAALRVLEETAAGARPTQVTEIADRSLAQLVAGVGACEAGHAHLLTAEA
ncbi:ferritin-like domain-containing protein [Salinactinospora qingdaonensis]|uniref:Ferritin-like domain-containing protein n=1 Tax=Salinactinospora qingdaonensis TaxID=702744 RepID=A0ABP7G8W8_9ACTN